MPYVRCACGNRVLVQEGQAGTRVRCRCGQDLTVPSLSLLRGARTPTDWADTVEREFLFLFTSQEHLARRISQESLFHYVSACDRLVARRLDRIRERQGIDIQLSCALFPTGRTLADIQVRPAGVLPAELLEELTRQLERLPSPRVEDGPVAFSARKMVWGGSDRRPEFDFPFTHYVESGEFNELLVDSGCRPAEPDPTDALPSRPTWWNRVVDLVSRWKRGVRAGRQPSPAAEPAPDTDAVMAQLALGCRTPAEVEQEIVRHPGVAQLYQRLGDLRVGLSEFERAIAAYDEYIRLAPSDSRGFALRGHAYCLAGSTRQGLADYTAALELRPADVGCLAARGSIFLELEAWSRAEADFADAIGHDPRHPGLYVDRARARYLQGKVGPALADLDAALALDPHHEMAYALRGTARQQRPNATVQDARDAAEDFTRALEISPDKAWYFAQRAEAYATQNKFTLAVADCDEAIALDPHCALAFGVRGFANQQLENYTEAIADCSEAIRLGLETIAVYMSRASAYGVQGELDQAIADCDSVLTLAPDFAAAFNLRGTLRLAQGDAEAALQDFADACRLAPNWATPYGHRANAHRVQAENEPAIEQYTRAIELEPNNLVALINRALTWVDLGDFDKAFDDLNELLRIDPDFVAGYYHRAELLLRQDEFDRALRDLDRAIVLQPDFGAAYFLRAQVLLHQHKNEDALRDYDRLVQLNPSLPAAFIGRAIAWIHSGNQDKASDDYREAVNLDPSSADDFLVARLLAEARVMHEQEDFAGSIARATDILERDPENLAALSARAASYWYSEQCVEAADDYSRLVDLMPNASHAYSGRGQVYAEMGEYDAALADLDKAVELARQAKSKLILAYALNGRALALTGLQRFEDAARDFEQSVQLCPDNAWVHYNRGLMYRTMGDLAQARECLVLALKSRDPALTPRKRERARASLAGH
ncbi:MAG: tetratricopeptide repeat protein [Planctomycetes bacterium]|nr:tetratricopeptide repeat protein [Planctomycetota bacterium]